jgi:hypothetical protein
MKDGSKIAPNVYLCRHCGMWHTTKQETDGGRS